LLTYITDFIADTPIVDSLKARLDKHWMHQDVLSSNDRNYRLNVGFYILIVKCFSHIQ